MRILITGVAGYIGSNLALMAKSKGYEVVGLDAFTDYYDVNLKRHTASMLASRGIDVVERNLVEGVEDLVRDSSVVVHLAAQPGISSQTSWEDYELNNILSTHKLLEDARRCDELELFVNIATSSCYGLDATGSESGAPKPASWYGVTKLAAEQEIMAANRGFGFPACSLRLFSVFGERERPDKLFPRLIRAIDNDSEFPLFEGSRDHKRSFTYVGDICDGILKVIENRESTIGEIFNLGTDTCFTTGDAISKVELLMGRRARFKMLSARQGDQKATHANIEKIRSRIGWEPKTSLEDGLRRMIDWYKNEISGSIDWN